VISRTGGEEFVVVFPATSASDAIDAVRRMQREMARSPFVFEGQSRNITFSGGAAQWLAGESLAQVLRRADTAMYDAKRQGKNRVAASTQTAA
jgi:diguanylate cyclase